GLQARDIKPGSSRRRGRAAHRRHHRIRLRKPSPALLRNLLPIHPDRELAGPTDHQLCIDSEILLQLSCHPGSFGPIASRVAVTDHHLHAATVAWPPSDACAPGAQASTLIATLRLMRDEKQEQKA